MCTYTYQESWEQRRSPWNRNQWKRLPTEPMGPVELFEPEPAVLPGQPGQARPANKWSRWKRCEWNQLNQLCKTEPCNQSPGLC